MYCRNAHLVHWVKLERKRYILSDVLNYNPGTFDNYLHHLVDATADGRFVPEGLTQ